jgi:hypothetical protein
MPIPAHCWLGKPVDPTAPHGHRRLSPPHHSHSTAVVLPLLSVLVPTTTRRLLIPLATRRVSPDNDGLIGVILPVCIYPSWLGL